MKNNRLCSNCQKRHVDESKQTFTYRNYLGNKCDSCISPVCDLCIKAGNYEDENGIQRLYLGNSRVPKDYDEIMIWGVE